MKRMLKLIPVFILVCLMLTSFSAKNLTAQAKGEIELSLKNTSKGIVLSWKGDKNEKYSVFKKNEKGKYVRTARVKGLKYTDTQVKSGQTYSYCVRKTKTEKSKHLSILHIAAPKNFSMKQKGKKITLTWKSAEGALRYELYKKTADGKWKKLSVLAADKNKFTEKLSSTAKKISYKLRAVTEKGKGAFTKVLTIRYVDPKKPMVALTYDDGPHPTHTHTILDVLEKYDARATFFVVGERITAYKDCLVRQNKLGCEIANHSYSHISLSTSSDKVVKKQINKTDKLIKKYSGQTCKLVRAPGGSAGKAARLIDKPFIHWSVDTMDWSSRSSSKVVAHIKKNVRDGSIILMHDLYSSTAEASKEIIPWLIKEGYQLVTVSEMMEAKGIKMKEGKVYYNGYT